MIRSRLAMAPENDSRTALFAEFELNLDDSVPIDEPTDFFSILP